MHADPGLVGIVASGVNRPTQIPGLLDDLFNGTVGKYSAKAHDTINQFTSSYTRGEWTFRVAAVKGARALAVGSDHVKPDAQ